MVTALNTKVLIVIVALLASIASYFAYEKHKEQVTERKIQEFRRPMTPQEKKDVDDALTGWGKSPATQNKPTKK